MSIKWFSLTIDAVDPPKLGRWWAEVLDYQVVFEEEGYSAIAKDEWTFSWDCFQSNQRRQDREEPHALGSEPPDQAAEVTRLLEMGAVKADIGQGEVPWVVMADSVRDSGSVI